MKTIQIDRDLYEYLVSKSAEPGESPSAILRRELHLPEPTQTIEIDDDTYNYLLSKTANFGESASDILRRALSIGEAPHPDPTGVIVFHIPAGTGSQSWNTRDNSLAATVGDTLRIVNDDSIPHRPHTSGIPFQHPATDILPGQSADFVLESAFDATTSQPLYDHAAGPNAQFWINVRPPQ